ncbi:MAG TPA: hypothetical protein VK729_02330 [Silvibacterium sp.]|jgi:hypothetical protein|nr:hypothetical protein [Silvibacterium sp.]
MNLVRIALASLGAAVAYFVYGFAMFAAWPSMKTEFKKYPNVYRTEESMMKVMPYGMVGILVSIVVIAILYAKIYAVTAGAVPGPVAGLASGACLGTLIGLFVVGMFVIHNYVNLNIGLKLTVYQGIAYFFQWLIVGAVIGLIYKPA